MKRTRSFARKIKTITQKEKSKKAIEESKNEQKKHAEKERIIRRIKRLANDYIRSILEEIEEAAKRGDDHTVYSLQYIDLKKDDTEESMELFADEIVRKLNAKSFSAGKRWHTHSYKDVTDENHTESYWVIDIKW